MIPRSYVKYAAAGASSWDIPTLVRQGYSWPFNLTGIGTIGIIELGGSWRFPTSSSSARRPECRSR